MKIPFDFAAKRHEAVFDLKSQGLGRYDTVPLQTSHRSQCDLAIQMARRRFDPNVQAEHQSTHTLDRMGDALDGQPFGPAFHATRERGDAVGNVHVQIDIARAAVAPERSDELPTQRVVERPKLCSHARVPHKGGTMRLRRKPTSSAAREI